MTLTALSLRARTFLVAVVAAVLAAPLIATPANANSTGSITPYQVNEALIGQHFTVTATFYVDGNPRKGASIIREVRTGANPNWTPIEVRMTNAEGVATFSPKVDLPIWVDYRFRHAGTGTVSDPLFVVVTHDRYGSYTFGNPTIPSTRVRGVAFNMTMTITPDSGVTGSGLWVERQMEVGDDYWYPVHQSAGRLIGNNGTFTERVVQPICKTYNYRWVVRTNQWDYYPTAISSPFTITPTAC